ncbi:tetraspanin-18-like [Silene latifolia]|uniref:tetraspanin-18-like n=1 Tax=Silene latifolia TaxID=37657 RepID=UPI003D76CC01
MRTNCCHQFFAFNLKFLNFFQFFVGISTVIYSAYLLNQWQTDAPIVPSPPPPLPAPPPSYPVPSYADLRLFEDGKRIGRFDGVGIVSGLDSDMGSGLFSQFYSTELPTPWFIYFLMVVGLLLCFMSCIGHIAAEAINGCCLCFYILLELIVILLEAALVAFIGIDRKWEKDLPFDQTGELDNLKSFIEKYADICKWLGITLLSLQALSLLLSLVLRAMISTRANTDVENDYVASEDRIREPLLNSQPNQSALPAKSDNRGTLSDFFATRMRQKYGLKDESSGRQSPSASSSPRA